MKHINRDWERWIVMAALTVPFTFQVESAAPDKADKTQAPPPPVRQIPGITAPDPFPQGCVDCHVYYPDKDLDVRLSSILSKWTNGVASPVMDPILAMVPDGTKLKGTHPALPRAALDDIPAACQNCHAKLSGKVPDFGPMMHVIHLSGANDGHFLSIFQGECTHCHKFESKTGIWDLPSGAEQKDVRSKSKVKTAALKVGSRPASQRTNEEIFYLIAFPIYLILFVCALVCLGFGIVARGQNACADGATDAPPQEI